MSGCKYPQHHESGSRSRLPAAAVAAVVLAALMWHKAGHAIVHAVDVLVLIVVAAVAAAVLAAVGWLLVRVLRRHEIRRPSADLPSRWRHLPAALRARIRWRWLARNVGAAPPDRHKGGKVRFPRALIYPDAHGIVARVRTVPGVGREDFEAEAEHIANYWRCHRVQVHQPKPGRLIVRGLRSDPLTQSLPMSAAPPGVYGSTSVQGPLRLYAGRDEFGADRWLPLPGVTGITVGGLPGYGKTSLINSWLMQLAVHPGVQFVIIDGKGGGDYLDWQDRAWLFTGDDLDAAAGVLEDVHALMRSRLDTVGQRQHRNAWHAGPTEGFPLIVTVVDECHGYFDESAVKGQRETEKHVRTCRALAGQLVKKGRSVLFLTVFITQKQTGDAIPTAIRDNCGLGVSFAVKTRDAASAALGDSIREYPSYCPTTLQDPAYVGVCTASLRTGQDPFVRIRVPEVTEEAAAARAAETASKRLDPRALVSSPQPIVANAPALVPDPV